MGRGERVRVARRFQGCGFEIYNEESAGWELGRAACAEKTGGRVSSCGKAVHCAGQNENIFAAGKEKAAGFCSDLKQFVDIRAMSTQNPVVLGEKA